MVKILLAILFTVLLIALGFYYYGSDDSPAGSSSNTNGLPNPAGAVDSAKGAVQQTQDLQDRINDRVNDQN